ncbi:MAG: folate-binding protein YgfZ [Bacteriovoracia bacterium]
MFAIYEPTPPHAWRWITLDGPDAQDFLHRLSTVNLKLLKEGQGARGCFLNAQGRMQAFYTLWKYGPQDFAFEFDAGPEGAGPSHLWEDGLLKFIDHYTFAERMKLTKFPAPGASENALACAWLLFDEGDAATAGLPSDLASSRTLATNDEIRLCHHGKRDFGVNWVTAWGRPARLRQWLDQAFASAAQLDFTALTRMRVENLAPWPSHELSPEVNPLEAGASDAIAQAKGCYPGQEVIERTLAIGSPARRLVQLEASQGAAPQVGDPVLNVADLPTEVGTFTTVVPNPEGGFTALALVRKIQAQPNLEVQTSARAKARVKRVAAYE